MKGKLIFILLLIFTACSDVHDNLLIGKWQASALLEEGAMLSIDTTQIHFEFSEDQSYLYTSTLNYREAGSYSLDASYLYTTDTLNQASSKKTVEILLLSEDSLHIKMEDNGRERILKLVRKH